MKVCFALTMLIFCTIANAQTKNRKWDVRLAAAGGSYNLLQDGGKFGTLNILSPPDVVESFYTGEVLYQLNNPKMQIGLAAARTNVFQNYFAFSIFGGSDDNHVVAERKVIAFMPAFEYSYLVRRNSSLYAEACLGVAVSNRIVYDAQTTKHSVNPAFQFTAIGYRFGRRIGGFAELGYGYKGIFQLGISGRF